MIGAEGNQIGIVPLQEAREAASEEGLDLVEIVPNSIPPVCRIMDYGKYQFGQSKKRQAARKKQKRFQVKNIKFRPNTGEGDYQIKMRNLRRFLDHGDKVKVTVRFRGREMVHPELGESMLERIVRDLVELAHVEQPSKLEGRQMVMVLAPGSK